MPYQNSLSGLSEAILDALRGLMVNALPDLNTQLASRPAPLSSITASAANFHIGDADTLIDLPFWIALVGGGRQDGRDMDVEIKQTGPGYWPHYYVNAYLYLNPQALPGHDAVVQAEARERLRAILVDWLVWDVINNSVNYTVALGSRQFAVSPAFDTLDEVKVTAVTKGFVFKSFGGTDQVFMAHALIEGRVYGGY